MITLQDYTREFIKQAAGEIPLSKSLLGRFAGGVSDATRKVLDAGKGLARKIKPTPAEEKKAIVAFWDSLAGKGVKATGKAMVAGGKLVGKAFTRDVGGGKRKLDILRGLAIFVPAAGAYYGIKKGKMKARQSRYYGQAKSPEIFADPRRRLR